MEKSMGKIDMTMSLRTASSEGSPSATWDPHPRISNLWGVLYKRTIGSSIWGCFLALLLMLHHNRKTSKIRYAKKGKSKLFSLVFMAIKLKEKVLVWPTRWIPICETGEKKKKTIKKPLLSGPWSGIGMKKVTGCFTKTWPSCFWAD